MVPKKILVVVVLILILSAIIGGGVMAYRSIQNKPKTLKPTPTPASVVKPTLTPTPTPTSMPVKEVLSDYKIQVLNGSGVAGQAVVIRDLLEKEGAKEVVTDNADSFDNKNTEIQFKKEVKEEVFAKLKEILSNYTVVKKDTLSKSSDYDIVITLGTKKTKIAP